HPVELATVGRNEADAGDQDGVDLPAAIAACEPVVERRFRPPARGNDPGADDRVSSVDRLADVGDLLARVSLDSTDVGAFQQIREKCDEFGLLGAGAAGPVAGQRTSRHLVEVEEVPGDLPYLRP